MKKTNPTPDSERSQWQKNRDIRLDAEGRVPPGMKHLVDEIRGKLRNQTDRKVA